MIDNGAFPPCETESCGLKVFSVWDVNADSSYDVTRRTPGKRFIAVRSLAGEGVLYFDDCVVKLGKDDVIFIYSESLRRYKCKDDFWRFHWVEFILEDSRGIVFNLPFKLTEDVSEKNAFAALFDLIKESGEPERELAVANLNLIIRKWICACGMLRQMSNAEMLVRKITRKMHEHLDSNWTIESMASESGVGSRYLRKIFHDVVGMGPKQYYEILKLNTCRELLELNLCNIKEAAFRTGFSSPFHLSREFRKYFGVPPSSLKTK